MPQIKVHEKALAHLTRGLYRSPASAIRELISNAWDANATTVRITTNAPNFFQLSIDDDGDGFTRQEFENLMQGGIGNSQKRPQNTELLHGRAVIGRLGIGMLGIAQICGAFIITSKTQTGAGFKARVRLYDLIKQRLDTQDQELIQSDEDGVTEVNVGQYDFLEFVPARVHKGTHILADELHPTFVRAFQRSVQHDAYKDPSLDWKNALRVVSTFHTLQELGDYWRLLWEIAASCPIPYVSREALPHGLIRDDQKRLEGYEFSVLVDGLQLFKPILLHDNPGGYTTTRIPRTTQRVYGREIVFHGYVLVQEGAQLHPDELRGILIRVKDVGIGYYDASMLDYRFNEGPRSRWLTGEVFVDVGLEDALNVDRDSFNRFHPEYRAIQEHVHGLLHEEIFPRVYKEIERRSTERAKTREESRTTSLNRVMTDALRAPVEVRFNNRPSSGDADVKIDKGPKQVRVSAPAPEEIATKRSQRQLASSILTVFEVAMQERTRERQREVFKKLLLELLSRW